MGNTVAAELQQVNIDSWMHIWPSYMKDMPADSEIKVSLRFKVSRTLFVTD